MPGLYAFFINSYFYMNCLDVLNQGFMRLTCRILNYILFFIFNFDVL